MGLPGSFLAAPRGSGLAPGSSVPPNPSAPPDDHSLGAAAPRRARLLGSDRAVAGPGAGHGLRVPQRVPDDGEADATEDLQPGPQLRETNHRDHEPWQPLGTSRNHEEPLRTIINHH